MIVNILALVLWIIIFYFAWNLLDRQQRQRSIEKHSRVSSRTSSKQSKTPSSENKPSKPLTPTNHPPKPTEPVYELPNYLEPGYIERKTLYLKSSQWNKKRKARLKIDNYECQVCKHNRTVIQEPLDVHHITYKNVFDEDVDTQLISLCRMHHTQLHNELGYEPDTAFPINILFKDKQ